MRSCAPRPMRSERTADVVRRLHEMGLEVAMITDDNELTAHG